MKLTKKSILSLILISTLALFSGCKTKEAPLSPPVKNVSVMHIKSKALSDDYRLTGNVKSGQSIKIASEIGGTIATFPWQVGDKLKKAQLIVSLNDKEYKLQIEMAKAEILALEAQLKRAKMGAREQEIALAEIQLNQARLAHEDALEQEKRIRELFSEDLKSEHDLVKKQAELKVFEVQAQVRQLSEKVKAAETQLDLVKEGPLPEDLVTLEAQLKQAKAKLSLLEAQLAKTKITAPQGGVVIQKLSEVGEIVGPGLPLMVIAQVDSVVIETLVPFEVAAQLEPGFEVTVETSDGQSFSGLFEKKLPLADVSTRKIPLEIKVENESNLLKPGMTVWVEFALPEIETGILVPAEAVIGRSDKRIVFLFNPETNLVEEKKVEVGRIVDDYLEITSGLSVDQWIVIEGAPYLSNQEEVKASLVGSEKS